LKVPLEKIGGNTGKIERGLSSIAVGVNNLFWLVLLAALGVGGVAVFSIVSRRNSAESIMRSIDVVGSGIYATRDEVASVAKAVQEAPERKTILDDCGAPLILDIEGKTVTVKPEFIDGAYRTLRPISSEIKRVSGLIAGSLGEGKGIKEALDSIEIDGIVRTPVKQRGDLTRSWVKAATQWIKGYYKDTLEDQLMLRMFERARSAGEVKVSE